MPIDGIKLLLHLGHRAGLVPALTARTADGEQPGIIHAQKHIAARTRCHAFLGRPKQAARRTTNGAADHHAKRPAHQKADAHAKAGADQGPRHGIRRAAQAARDGAARHTQAKPHRASAQQIAKRHWRCRTATTGKEACLARQCGAGKEIALRRAKGGRRIDRCGEKPARASKAESLTKAARAAE